MGEPTDGHTLELFRLEYEKAAERYQEIYRSMWAIFSYLSVVSAGVIGLGIDKVQLSPLAIAATSPLLFWFWSTYLPLDRYGDKVLRRLAHLEEKASSLFGFEMNHYKGAVEKSAKHSIVESLWEGWCAKSFWTVFRKQVTRARFVIWVCFLGLQIAWFAAGISFIRSGGVVRLESSSVAPSQTISILETAPALEVR